MTLAKWTWFATFTFRSLPRLDWAIAEIENYLQELEKAATGPVHWIYVEDFGTLNGRFHFHVLIAGVDHISIDTWEREARRRFGYMSEIRPYESKRGAAHYIAQKAVSQDRNWHLGGTQLNRRGPFQIYIDGVAGRRPDGKGSGYAFYNQTTFEKRVKWIDGLTNNEAAYQGLRYALQDMPSGSVAVLFSDSRLMAAQFQEKRGVRKPELEDLLLQVREIIRERRLRIELIWIPREQNLARKLLDSE